LGLGIVAILLHSLSDFGQHLPANAMLTAIFCALLMRLSRMTDAAGDETETRPALSGVRWYGCVAAAVVVGLVGLWSVLAANGARAAEAHWRRVLSAEERLIGQDWQGSHEDYIHLLDHAEQAVHCQPGNVKYAHWLNVYRWQTICRTVDPNTKEVLLSEEALAFAGRIGDEFNRARTLCPTFGANWCVLGQLERAVLGRQEDGARHIQRGVELAPCDATARLVAGMLALEEGDTQVAAAHLARAVELDRRLFHEVALRLIDTHDLPEIALEIAGDHAHRLRVIAGMLEEREESSEAVKAVRAEMVAQLEEQSLDPDAPAWVFASLAGVYRQENRLEDAIVYYRRALTKDYGQVDWRYRLAWLLAETGSAEQAIEEAETCLRLRPSHGGARRLIDRLSSQVVRREANAGR